VNILTDASVLRPAEGLAVEELDDGAVVWEPARRRLHRLDLPGREVLRSVDGRRTVSEICASVADTFGVDRAVVRRDAVPFLADLITKGVLTDA
jgi:hypothetical protein